MNYELIMLPNPIVVSDEEIKDGDSLYYASTNVVFRNYMSETPRRKDDYKIIAGIPELPTIDFSALSEEECKNIGWVDVKKLAKEKYPTEYAYLDLNKEFDINLEKRLLFIDGFKAAQSLNEKNFSEEEVIDFTMNMISQFHVGNTNIWNKERLKESIQSLSKPKVFQIEVEMQRNYIPGGSVDIMDIFDDHDTITYTPKITKNSIKILKVL